jgi:hypothetical protein
LWSFFLLEVLFLGRRIWRGYTSGVVHDEGFYIAGRHCESRCAVVRKVCVVNCREKGGLSVTVVIVVVVVVVVVDLSGLGESRKG